MSNQSKAEEMALAFNNATRSLVLDGNRSSFRLFEDVCGSCPVMFKWLSGFIKDGRGSGARWKKFLDDFMYANDGKSAVQQRKLTLVGPRTVTDSRSGPLCVTAAAFDGYGGPAQAAPTPPLVSAALAPSIEQSISGISTVAAIPTSLDPGTEELSVIGMMSPVQEGDSVEMHHIGGPELDASDILLSDGGGSVQMEVMSSGSSDSDEDYEEKDFDARESFLADNKEKGSVREKEKQLASQRQQKKFDTHEAKRSGLQKFDDKSMHDFCVEYDSKLAVLTEAEGASKAAWEEVWTDLDEKRGKQTHRPVEHAYEAVLAEFQIVYQQFYVMTLIGEHLHRLCENSEQICDKIEAIMIQAADGDEQLEQEVPRPLSRKRC
jgi:hypothetical protein